MQRSNLHTIVARIFGHSHDCRGAAIRAKVLLGLLRTCLLLGSVSGRGHLVAGSWAVARLGSRMLSPVPHVGNGADLRHDTETARRNIPRAGRSLVPAAALPRGVLRQVPVGGWRESQRIGDVAASSRVDPAVDSRAS